MFQVNEQNDMFLASNGRLAETTLSEQIVQQIESNLLTQTGEWFLDLRIGVPWLFFIRSKVNTIAIREYITLTILNVPGVAGIPSLNVELDSRLRELEYTAQVILDTGELVEINNGV